MLITFALGLAAVWFAKNIDFSQKAEKHEVTLVGIVELPKFAATFRACGMGYVQGYETRDGQELTESNMDCREPKSSDKRIVRRDADNIIRKMKFEGHEYFEIYPLRKGDCITAPTIELGLELQEYLRNRSK